MAGLMRLGVVICGICGVVAFIIICAGNIYHGVGVRPELGTAEPRVSMPRAEPASRDTYTGDMGQAGRRVGEVYTMTATAYSYTGNPTASGVMPRKGLVAADWEQLPKGTKIFVEGYGLAEVADTGGLIKAPWNRKDGRKYAELDLYFPDRKTALDWGRREVRVYVYNPGIPQTNRGHTN
jgi:3D (Asp-Asp-Asp) domain-containing protein